MLLLHVQESTLEAADLISQRELEEASEILVCILKTLQETDYSNPANNAQELQFLPVSPDCRVACPEWDEEFFGLPFAMFAHEAQNNAEYHVTEIDAAACAGACLYMLGLCYQISAQESKKRCPEAALRSACSFYGHAWQTLQNIKPSTLSTLDESGTSFLRMAISTNVGHCCYHLGELEAANAWQHALDELLSSCLLKDDNITLELHDFFMMSSTVSTGFVAAAAA
eukprot:CAMPEP_0172448736 /NCGR_PEP_ID=MMETSP1065-20121228/7676_1 /TAXON_ID=265537 /ORGANISM="Amphiprora paludosa, Strain CCMP125" /LENGTH=226 /DNA_ID=CAMNT_0013200307 /DNA_START=81 /DNA_END=761 /DNA_ORIENTATION=+